MQVFDVDGKLYEGDEIPYIGSTIKTLDLRFCGHESFIKSNPNSEWSTYVMARGGSKNFKIELIEDFPCRTLLELVDRERYYIQKLNPVCNIMLRAPNKAEKETLRLAARAAKTAKAQLVPLHMKKYVEIEAITPKQADKIRLLRREGEASREDLFALEKYEYDTRLVENKDCGEDVKAEVFDLMMKDSDKRRILVNLHAYITLDLNQADGDENSRNPYLEMCSDLPAQVSAVRELCIALGMTCLTDMSFEIKDAELLARKETIKPLLSDLQRLLKARKSESKKETGPNLKNEINTILSTFCECKFGPITKVRYNTGSRKRTYKYGIVPSEYSQKVFSVLRTDSVNEPGPEDAFLAEEEEKDEEETR